MRNKCVVHPQLSPQHQPIATDIGGAIIEVSKLLLMKKSIFLKNTIKVITLYLKEIYILEDTIKENIKHKNIHTFGRFRFEVILLTNIFFLTDSQFQSDRESEQRAKD